MPSSAFSLTQVYGDAGAGGGGTSSDVNGASSLPARLGAAGSMEKAAAIITEALVARVAKTLQTTVGEIDTERFLHSYGIDSLAAIELVNWALKECQSHINVFDIMAAVPIWATAKKIAANSKFQQLKIMAAS